MKLIDADNINLDHIFANSSDFIQEDREVMQMLLDSQPEIGQWIPVKERLPDKQGYYWATVRHAGRTLTTEKKSYDPERPDHIWTDSLDDPYDDKWCEVIIAWQPYYCPEPYDP